MRQTRPSWSRVAVGVAVGMALICGAVTQAGGNHLGPAGAGSGAWKGHLERVDEALARKDVSLAERALVSRRSGAGAGRA